MAFNDFHGHLTGEGLTLNLPDPSRAGARLRVPTGSAAALAGLVQALRHSAPNSVLVSSGDAVGAAPLVSSLFRHESTIEVLNQIGVDVGVVGNHEFDAGLAELQRLAQGGCAADEPGQAARSCALHRFEGARFPLLAANVQSPGKRAPFAAHWVRQVQGVKVGFIGVVTRSTPGIVRPSGIAGLRFGDEAEAINREVAALQAQGVHALVAVLHEGGEWSAETGSNNATPPDWNDRRCPGWQGAMAELLPRISPAVDLVLNAHTHQGYLCMHQGRPVMQAVSYGRGLSVADLVIDRHSGRVDRSATQAANLPVLAAQAQSSPSEPPAATAANDVTERLAQGLPEAFAQALRQARAQQAVAQTVETYRRAAQPVAERPVGRIAASVGRQGEADSPLGRLVADAQWAATRAPEAGGAQFALMNPGGLRANLECRSTPPCTVSFGQAFSAQPFGNNLVVLSLSGTELLGLLEQQQPPGRSEARFLQPSAGLRYRWQAAAPFGQRVRDVHIHGQALQPQMTYRLTVNNFLAEGGDGFADFRLGRQRLGGPQDIDALVNWLQAQAEPVVPDPENRIQVLR
jgi:5'-nucleotidase